MQKLAITEHPVHDLIRQRWSPRSFSDKAVPADALKSLFEAARWTASSHNEQPWVYIVATRHDGENFGKLLSVLNENNVVWAKNAAVLALSVARLSYANNGTPNRAAIHDVGAANAQLTLEATAHGLAVHLIGGFALDKARELFQIPAGWEPVNVLTIGYPGDPNALSEPLRQREVGARTRKPLSEFVMSCKWGETSPVVR